MCNDDISDIVEWAESQGWTVQVDKNGYRRFFDLDGNYIALSRDTEQSTPASPGCAHRGQEGGASMARAEQEATTGTAEEAEP